MTSRTEGTPGDDDVDDVIRAQRSGHAVTSAGKRAYREHSSFRALARQNG